MSRSWCHLDARVLEAFRKGEQDPTDYVTLACRSNLARPVSCYLSIDAKAVHSYRADISPSNVLDVPYCYTCSNQIPRIEHSPVMRKVRQQDAPTELETVILRSAAARFGVELENCCA